ncbi:ribonuclease Z [Candidatus Cloacimonadota bacterium]
MKIRILGSAPGYPVPGKNHACVLVNSQNMNILLDCGEGAAQQLMKFNFHKNEIDSIIISHMHPDHITGIYMVLLMFYLNNRTKGLKIFLPEFEEQFENSLNMFYLFREKSSFSIQILKIKDLDVELVEPVLNDHLSRYKELISKNCLPNKAVSYSFVIRENNKRLVYTSDVLSLSILSEILLDSDLVILDSVHPKLDEIVKYVKEQDYKFVINHGLSDAMKSILTQIPEERYQFADEEHEIII